MTAVQALGLRRGDGTTVASDFSGRGRLGRGLASVALVAALAGCADTPSTTGPSDLAPSQPTVAPSQPKPDGPEAVASREALERYIEASRTEVEAEIAAYREVYSDFTLRAEGAGTLVYEYTYRDQLDAAPAREGILEGRPELEEIAVAHIFPGMRSAGVTEPGVRWVYLNADGTQIVSIDVES